MQKMIICAILLSSMFAMNAMDQGNKIKTSCCWRGSAVPGCEKCVTGWIKQDAKKNSSSKETKTTVVPVVPKLNNSQDEIRRTPILNISKDEMHRCP